MLICSNNMSCHKLSVGKLNFGRRQDLTCNTIAQWMTPRIGGIDCEHTSITFRTWSSSPTSHRSTVISTLVELYSSVRSFALALARPDRESKTMDFAPCWASHLVTLLQRPPTPPVIRYVASDRINGCGETMGITWYSVNFFRLLCGPIKLTFTF